MIIDAIQGSGTTAGLMQISRGVSLGMGQLTQTGKTGSFQQFFAEAIKNTDLDQKDADLKIQQLLTGETEDLHQVMIAMEKANLSFQLTMQIRNKVVEAYQEIMRMQI